MGPDPPTLQPVIEPTNLEPMPTASHSSIKFNIPAELLPGVLKINGDSVNITNENTTIGFLNPSSTYDWKFIGNSTTFSGQSNTEPNPYSWAMGDNARIRPGVPTSKCTLAWILRDATNETLYALTAGHCYEVGSNVSVYGVPSRPPLTDYAQTVDLVGPVVYQVDNTTHDYAIMKIVGPNRHLVSPELAYWTGPNGITSPGSVEFGSTVCFTGTGGPMVALYELRPRCGDYWRSSAAPGYSHNFLGTAVAGDSGAPLIDYDSGRAMGIVADVGAGYVSFQLLCHALDWLERDHGVELRLATSSYSPPPPLGFDVPLPAPPVLNGSGANCLSTV